MRPLTITIENGVMTIAVGLDVLAFATENHPDLYDAERDRGRYKVTDPALFCREVIHELHREEEDGTTAVHVMLDTAILNAISDGAEGVEEIPS